MNLERIGEAAHRHARAVLSPGARAVDATVGNGHDTLFLAQAVGPEGAVLGLDVQAAALAAARRRLDEAGVAARVRLVEAGHERLGTVAAAWRGTVAAVLFNLGYLPGSNRRVATRAATTLPALTAARDLLGPGGRLVVMAYRGHTGGAEEAAAVAAWCRACDPRAFEAVAYERLNGARPAPVLFVVARRGRGAALGDAPSQAVS